MRRILLTTGALLLAACGSEPASEPAAPPPATGAAHEAGGPTARPEARAFRDWRASCDNGGQCFAFAGPLDDPGGAGWVRLVIPAGPDGVAGVTAGMWPADDATGDLVLEVDGRRWPLAVARGQEDADYGSVLPDATARVVAALAQARSVRVVRGAQAVGLSPSGAAAALLWIDERQGRLGTTTALVRRGEAAAATVPPAPILPMVAPAPIVAQTDLPTALPPALSVRADVAECRSNLQWNPGLFADVSRARLDARTELWSVPCDAGAYNLITRHFLTGPGGADPRPLAFSGASGEAQGELVNAAYDPATRRLSQFAKGRGLGDCGVAQSWNWTGQAFVLSQEAVMGECWGVPSDLWPTTWRTR